MKATELMHGDWYSALNGDNKRDYYQFDFNDECWGDAEPLPIPLTPEMLEANGFEVEENDSYVWGIGLLYTLTVDEGIIQVYWHDNCGDSDLIWYANIAGFNACVDMTRRNKSLYVHELQHALRLCGLNEIADNFKLK